MFPWFDILGIYLDGKLGSTFGHIWNEERYVVLLVVDGVGIDDADVSLAAFVVVFVSVSISFFFLVVVAFSRLPSSADRSVSWAVLSLILIVCIAVWSEEQTFHDVLRYSANEDPRGPWNVVWFDVLCGFFPCTLLASIVLYDI